MRLPNDFTPNASVTVWLKEMQSISESDRSSLIRAMGPFIGSSGAASTFAKGMIQITGPDQGKGRHSGIRTGRFKIGRLSLGKFCC